jgi:hypothetical protein
MKGLILEQTADLAGMEKQKYAGSQRLVGEIKIPFAHHPVNADVLVDANRLAKIHQLFVH